jgi:hypothetical protein
MRAEYRRLATHVRADAARSTVRSTPRTKGMNRPADEDATTLRTLPLLALGAVRRSPGPFSEPPERPDPLFGNWMTTPTWTPRIDGFSG